MTGAERIVRVKALLALEWLEQKEIARLTGMSAQNVSSIKGGRTGRGVDASLAAAWQCPCGKVGVDPLDECIYIVATDEYFCSQECIT